MTYLVIFLIIIWGPLLYGYVQEANSNKKLIVSLKKSIDSYKHEKAVLLNLIDHLFFSEKLSLEEQSEMSRQFFNKEDLVKYQWTTLTK